MRKKSAQRQMGAKLAQPKLPKQAVLPWWRNHEYGFLLYSVIAFFAGIICYDAFSNDSNGPNLKHQLQGTDFARTMDLLSSEQKSQYLWEWCQENGVSYNPKITLNHESSENKVRGVVVAKHSYVHQGEVLISLHNDRYRITSSRAINDRGVGLGRAVQYLGQQRSKSVPDNDVMISYLVLSRRHQTVTEAGLYAHTLPAEAPDTPVFWPQEDPEQLPLSIAQQAIVKQAFAEESFRTCRLLISLCKTNDGRTEKPLNVTEFRWAYQHFYARAFEQESAPWLSESERRANLGKMYMEPAGDMLNFSPLGRDPNNRNTASAERIGTFEGMLFIARRNLKPGDEITWDYGTHELSTLMFCYGLVPLLPRLPELAYLSVWDMAQVAEYRLAQLAGDGDALESRKRALLRDMGMVELEDGEQPFIMVVSPGTNGVPSPLMGMARLLAASTASELTRMESQWISAKRVAPLNAAEALSAIKTQPQPLEARAVSVALEEMKRKIHVELNESHITRVVGDQHRHPKQQAMCGSRKCSEEWPITLEVFGDARNKRNGLIQRSKEYASRIFKRAIGRLESQAAVDIRKQKSGN